MNLTTNVTEANTICDLAGFGLDAGVSAYNGIGGGVGALVGADYGGAEFNIGLGTPGLSFSAIPTWTSVYAE